MPEYFTAAEMVCNGC